MATVVLAMTLMVRLYDNGALADGQRAAAVATASEILLVSHIPTTWPECTPPKPKPHATDAFVCSRPMGPGDVAIRLVRGARPAHVKGDVPLGYSLLDRQAAGGTLATIYLDRVDWIAATSGIDAQLILGRAIAHEIGHLLLGTNTHGDAGLMRAVWSRRTLERNDAADWLFTAAETSAMHRALGRRVPVTETASR